MSHKNLVNIHIFSSGSRDEVFIELNLHRRHQTCPCAITPTSSFSNTGYAPCLYTATLGINTTQLPTSFQLCFVCCHLPPQKYLQLPSTPNLIPTDNSIPLNPRVSVIQIVHLRVSNHIACVQSPSPAQISKTFTQNIYRDFTTPLINNTPPPADTLIIAYGGLSYADVLFSLCMRCVRKLSWLLSFSSPR